MNLKLNVVKIDFTEKYNMLLGELKNIKKKEKILLFAHNDADGITSAFIIAKIFEKLGFKYKVNFDVQIVDNNFRYEITKERNRKIYSQYDYFFFVDYSLNNYDVFMGKPVFVIDHHKQFGKRPKILINPAITQENPEKLPSASAVCYDFYRFCFGHDDLVKDVAFLGALGDLMLFASLPYLDISPEDNKYFINYLVQRIYNNAVKLFSLNSNITKKQIFEYLYFNLKENILPLILIPKEWVDTKRKIEKRFIKRLKKIIENTQKYKDIVFIFADYKDNGYYDDIKNTIHGLYRESIFLFKRLPNNLGYSISARSKKII